MNNAFRAVKAAMLPAGTFTGRSVLVTGGATGIGRAIAERFAQLGANVAMMSRNTERLAKAVEEIRESTKAKVCVAQADVRDANAVSAALDRAERELNGGPFDVIINNAAANFLSPTERLSPNAFRTITDVVLLGTFIVTRECGRRLIAAGKPGAFLAITTTYTENGSPFVVPSASAKAGVETMYKSLSAEWAPKGFRLNCIAPGPVETYGAFSRLDPTGEYRERLKKVVAVGRVGEVEELANLASYMCSDYASWLTGAVIRYDGGMQPNIAGHFSEMKSITKEQWDLIESTIRSTKNKS